MHVADNFLIDGTILAAQNAKRFLEDSISLFNLEKYGSASIIGVIALENIGRGRWLREQLHDIYDPKTKQVRQRRPIEQNDFRDALIQDHQRTIRTAMTTLQLPPAEENDLFLEDFQKTEPGTPERATALAKFKHRIAKVFNIAAANFHETRTLVQYVDPDQACMRWRNPQNVSKKTASQLLNNIYSNYQIFSSELFADPKVGPVVAERNLKSELEISVPRPKVG